MKNDDRADLKGPLDISANLQSLRAALEKEAYPCPYCHKFIGENTPAFHDAARELERRFPKVRKTGERGSGGGEGQPRYVAYSYDFIADNVDEIMALIQFTSGMAGLKVIL